MGYFKAGFTDIVGVDIFPQKNYPFAFIQGDALTYVKQNWREFDCIHASPPCQAYGRTAHLSYKRHLLIEPVRSLLKQTDLPYVIENVMGAPLLSPIRLCGAMFSLKVYRHRLFESNVVLVEPVHHKHNDSIPRAGRAAISKNGFLSVVGHFSNVEYARLAMGIDWMTRNELSQAIPPAFTQYIGQQLL